MKDITIIVPVHEYNDDVKTLLAKALKSVPSKTDVILSCGANIAEDVVKEYGNTKYYTIINSEDASFCSLVNNGVEYVKTPWFSILEFDDEYTSIWFNNFSKYLEFNPNISIFMPLTDLYDYKEKRFVGYGNEAVWASSFSNELGYVDNDCLQNYFDFYLTGSIFNTEDWRTYGGLKNSIKLTFWYEFLLRMTHNGKKVMVIPRVGYIHNLNRDGSLLNTYSDTISEKESEGWLDIAKREYFFKNDRNKVYVENNEEEA